MNDRYILALFFFSSAQPQKQTLMFFLCLKSMCLSAWAANRHGDESMACAGTNREDCQPLARATYLLHAACGCHQDGPRLIVDAGDELLWLSSGKYLSDINVSSRLFLLFLGLFSSPSSSTFSETRLSFPFENQEYLAAATVSVPNVLRLRMRFIPQTGTRDDARLLVGSCHDSHSGG